MSGMSFLTFAPTGERFSDQSAESMVGKPIRLSEAEATRFPGPLPVRVVAARVRYDGLAIEVTVESDDR